MAIRGNIISDWFRLYGNEFCIRPSQNNNQQLVEEFALVANEKNIAPAQLALAWVLAQGDDIIPVPGTRKRKYLEEKAAAVDVTITPADLEKIENLQAKYPDIGQRYSDGALKLVNH